MINTEAQRVKISQLIQNQLPEFVVSENPLFVDFLKSYYISQDHHGGPSDLGENLDYYTKFDSLVGSALTAFTELSYSIESYSKTITVKSAAGFPDSYGLLKIDDEIITYTGVKAVAPSQTFTVKVAQSEVSGENIKFFVDGEESPLLSLKKSGTYTFDQSHISNTGYYLKFSTTQDGTWNAGVAYTTGVTATGTPGKDGKVKIVVSENAPLTLYVFNESVESMYGDGEISVDPLVKNTFTGCIRGFSGIDELQKRNRRDVLSFISTKASSHKKKAKVQNLSSLFAREFYKKIKSTYATDFEGVDFNSEIDKINFIRQIKDFYLAKGTDESFKILFRVLFGVESKIIKPQDHLFKPSDADYTKSYKIVVQHANKLYRNRGIGELLNVPDVKEVEGSTLVQSSPRVLASISNVSEFRYNDESYYILSVPTDQSVGRFSISNRTRLTSDVSANATSLTVDSTLGFPSSGTLVLNGYETVKYSSKTFNQFLGLSSFSRKYSYGDDVILQSGVYAYSAVQPDLKIDLIITGVLSNLDIPKEHKLLRSGDVIRAGQQGVIKEESDEKFNSWVFNASVNFEIKSITSTLVAGSFQIQTKSKHNFIDKDSVEIIYKKSGEKVLCTVSSVTGSNTLIVSGATNLIPDQAIYIRRKTLFGKSDVYKGIEKYTTDVQNVYDNNGDLYVTSPSIPSLLQRSIDVSDRSVSWEGSSSGTIVQVTTGFVDHGFYSGDLVKYTTLSGSLGSLINKKNYYVKRVDSNRIRFANSLVDLVNERFVNVNGTGKFKIEIPDFSNKSIENQKLLKRIQQKPNFDGSKVETLSGTTGILINGVEILNYKSGDKVFYGPIESINVLGGGENYDVVNPPSVIFESDNGTGASAICCVKGSLQKIEVIEPGFDYIETPTITITGGNGQGATAEVRMESFLHFVDLDASSGNTVDLTNNLIGFGTFHKFENGEEVIYKTFGKQGIGIAGVTTTLVNNSSYFISRVGPSSIALANDPVSAINGTNLINLTSFGIGKHRFESAQLKQKIGEIVVTNSGSGYANQRRLIKSVGINTFTSTLTYKNHNFNDGDLVQYKTNSVSIGGLNNNNYYNILKIDDNNFRLCFAGSSLSSISQTNYQTQQYVGLTSFGSGNHVINYPPISVTVSGKIGIKKSAIEDYTAKVRPLFRGSITSVDVETEGRNYGYSTIINNERPVSIRVSAANTQSSYKAIVNDVGSITDVIISKTGGGYVSPPELIVFGSGIGAELVAVSAGSSVTSVKIKNGGVGYSTSNLSIVEQLPGNGAKFFVNLKSWTVNNVKRFENKLTSDDGFLVVGDSGNGIKFTSLYAPRELRKSLKQKNNDGSINYTQNDLQFIGNVEKDSKSHSPIIGWAYDGNPIYGPYGYENKNGGKVKLLSSSYSLKSSRTNGPPTNTFPLGFFIDDYEYLGNGDLDENNGRFCVTPDYPEGTYAYFATFSSKNSTSGTFKNYKEPKFPYLIGQNYAANPDEYNFNKFNNQDKNINTNQFHRNTYPYRLGEIGSFYEGLYQNNFIEEIKIKSSSTGGIDSAIIENAGDGFKVGETFILDKDTVTGSGFYAEVTNVRGKPVKSVSSSITEIENVVILYNKGTGQITGYSPTPHSLINNDLVTISGVSTESFKKLNRQFNISVVEPVYSLSRGIGNTSATGIVTTIYVSGPDINDTNNIAPNDILSFGNEQMLVLNVDSVNNGLRVLRKYSNTGGGSISAGNKLTLGTKKITFNSGINTDVETNRNLPYYFNPEELVGIGTTFGVGIGSTIAYTINVPGNISTTRFIPTRTIYLPSHKFKTGDSLTYSNGSSSSIVVSNGSTTFSLQDSSTVYAIATSLDLLGISTTKNGTQLSFVSVGSGKYHSFTPQKQEHTITVEKIIATVVCEEAHNLSLLDNVELSLTPGISTTISVRYDLDTNLTTFNPITFNSTGINTNSSKITIQNHGLQDGDKILYSSSNPATPLQNKKSYYAIRLDKNNIRLATTYFNAIKDFPTFVGIATTGGPSHTISKINPRVDLIEGFKVVFDLSDSSLSQSVSGKKIEVFDFNLYRDKNFTIPYHSNRGENKFNVVKIGKVGIGTAKIQFDVTENTPKQIFYRLEPKSLDLIDDKHKNPIIDDDVFSNNTLNVIGKSFYNQESTIVGLGTTTFQINLKYEPEKSSFKDTETTNLKYSTTSTEIKGPIDKIRIYSPGVDYNYPPNVSSIGSTGNSTAIIKLSGQKLGKIKNTELINFGFNYSSDLTLRPTVVFPQVVRLESLSKLKTIKVVKGGKNYTTPPNIIVVDATTNLQSSGFVFDTKLTGTSISNVKILTSPDELFSVEPKVFAVNNTNGVGIQTVSFNVATKLVTITLNKTFTSATFPFKIGDSIFVENIGITSTGSGFNSSDYQYKIFTVTGVTTSTSQLKYQISSINPGTFSPTKSSGRVILSSDLPEFKATIEPSKFSKNETIYTKDGKNFGEIISMDQKNKIAKIISNVKQLRIGDVIVGRSSKSSAVVSSSETVVSYFNVNSSAFTIDGWQKDTGILSNELQKIHDSDYYQHFSYSVQSTIPKQKWESVVDSTAHVVGFKNFADLQVISIPENSATVKPAIITTIFR